MAIAYCILGPLLLFIESKLYGSDAMRQALPITLLAIFFLHITWHHWRYSGNCSTVAVKA